MTPKEINDNLHYDDVRVDCLRPPHGTTPATVNKSQKVKNGRHTAQNQLQ